MHQGEWKVPGTSCPPIPPLVGFVHTIQNKLHKFPFEKNVFLMMRFRETNRALSDFIVGTLKDAGLNGVRADDDDWNLTGNVYNPIAVLYCCKYGIALFDEPEEGQVYNANVIYELAMMHCLDRECLILKNAALPELPFDLIKNLYMPYKGELAVRTNVQKWLRQAGLVSHAEHLPPRNKTAGSNLQLAAAEAFAGEVNPVIKNPEDVEATDFRWKVISKTTKTWKVSWQMKLRSKSERALTLTVLVLFLDEKGYALLDITSPKIELPPAAARTYRQTATFSADLANRIRRGILTVSKSGQKGSAG